MFGRSVSGNENVLRSHLLLIHSAQIMTHRALMHDVTLAAFNNENDWYWYQY